MCVQGCTLRYNINDFVLASYTFGCVKMSAFVPNNRHLRDVLIFFFHSKKTVAEAHRELQKVYGDADLIGSVASKTVISMTTLGLTLPNPLKPTWKCSNGKSYPTRRIPKILRSPIITGSGRWHMVWLIISNAHMKTSKNVLIRG